MANVPFRRVALERLSSPEQLDTLLQIGSTRGWLALLALLALIGAAAVWSVAGTIRTRVEAPAVLIRPGGVLSASARGAGTVAQVLVREGDTVREGQLLATIEQPELAKEIEGARVQLAEMRAQHAQTASYASRESSLRSEAFDLEQRTLEDTIRYAEGQLAALTEQLANEEAVLARGLVTRQRVLQTRQAIFQATDQLERARNELKQLAIAALDSRNQRDQEVQRSTMAINDAARRLAAMERNFELQSEVRSPYDGVVVEVSVAAGSVVARGAPIVSLQSAADDGGLQAVIYVPPAFGKSITPGMPAQVSPAGSPREEYGFIHARVTYVSEFPATAEGMMRILANESLVQTLSRDGAPFAVYASLVVDPGSASGFRWSSERGAALPVASGTICTVRIVTREQRPIELVIPLARELIGG